MYCVNFIEKNSQILVVSLEGKLTDAAVLEEDIKSILSVYGEGKYKLQFDMTHVTMINNRCYFSLVRFKDLHEIEIINYSQFVGEQIQAAEKYYRKGGLLL